MNDLDDASVEPAFTAQSSARLVEAGHGLVSALQSYVAAAAAVTDETGVETLEESEWAVQMAAARFDDAHFDHLGVFAPVGDADLLDDDSDDEEDEGNLDDAIVAGGAVSVVSRQDFVVTDAEAVFAAASEAWSRTREEPADKADIPSAGHALYELIHDGGRDSLNNRPGLMPLASITVFRQPEAPLDGARMDEADTELEAGFPSLFAPDGPTLFSFGEQWG